MPLVDGYRARERFGLHAQREPGRIALNDGYLSRRQWFAEQFRGINFGLRGRRAGRNQTAEAS
jgi:hypothetical protein